MLAGTSGFPVRLTNGIDRINQPGKDSGLRLSFIHEGSRRIQYSYPHLLPHRSLSVRFHPSSQRRLDWHFLVRVPCHLHRPLNASVCFLLQIPYSVTLRILSACRIIDLGGECRHGEVVRLGLSEVVGRMDQDSWTPRFENRDNGIPALGTLHLREPDRTQQSQV
jgi:hypothetical protein